MTWHLNSFSRKLDPKFFLFQLEKFLLLLHPLPDLVHPQVVLLPLQHLEQN